MRTPKSKTKSQKPAGSASLARRRAEDAEKRWKAAREQASLAKRHRKEVKLITRRTRKLAKQAKADLAKARKALAEAEAKLASVAARPKNRKLVRRKARSVDRVATTLRDQATKSGQPRPLSTTPMSALESMLINS